MAIPTWGMLEKSQVDPETIEEAIARLITEHNENEEAHLGEGQSLQSHKASEIIDHLAASIIFDKIKNLEVGVSKLKWDKIDFSIDFATVDRWSTAHLSTGGKTDNFGSEELHTGTTINSRGCIFLDSFAEGEGPQYTKNPKVMFAVKLKNEGNSAGSVVVGTLAGNCFGFKQINNKLYSFHRADPDEVTTEIATIPNDWTYYRLKAVYTSGSKIEFYLDDVLVATHTVDLPESGPDASDELRWFDLRITNQEAANKRIWVRNILFSQDY